MVGSPGGGEGIGQGSTPPGKTRRKKLNANERGDIGKGCSNSETPMLRGEVCCFLIHLWSGKGNRKYI